MGLAERTAGACSQERLRVQPGLGTAQLLSRQQDCGPALQGFFRVLLRALGAGPGCPDPAGVLRPAVCRSCCVPLAVAVCCAGGAAPPWCAVCGAGVPCAPTCRCNKAVCAVKGSALRTLLGRVCSPHRDNAGSAGPRAIGTVPCRAVWCRGCASLLPAAPTLVLPVAGGVWTQGVMSMGLGRSWPMGGCFPGAFAILRFPGGARPATPGPALPWLCVMRLFVAGEGGGGAPGQHAGLEEGHPAQEAGGGEVSRVGWGLPVLSSCPQPTLTAPCPLAFTGSRNGECRLSPSLAGGWARGWAQ